MLIIYKNPIKLLLHTGLKVVVKKRFLHYPSYIEIALLNIKSNLINKYSFINSFNVKMKQQSLMYVCSFFIFKRKFLVSINFFISGHFFPHHKHLTRNQVIMWRKKNQVWRINQK